MTFDHTHFMRRAIALSLEKMEAGAGGPFGAVVVRNGQVIGEGWNRVTSLNDPTAHAEVVAIREACRHLGTFQLHDTVLYTSCEPCPMCLAAAYWARIPTLYYANTQADAKAIGFDDQWIYEEFAKPHDKRTLTLVPLLQEEAKAAFEAWVKKADKIAY